MEFFSSYEYLDKSQNKVKVYVDSILYDKILKNQVSTIYNDKINQFEISDLFSNKNTSDILPVI